MGKVIPKILLGLAALLLCVYIVFQIYNSNSSKVEVETALSMQMEDTVTVEGIALREETVLSFTGWWWTRAMRRASPGWWSR